MLYEKLHEKYAFRAAAPTGTGPGTQRDSLPAPLLRSDAPSTPGRPATAYPSASLPSSSLQTSPLPTHPLPIVRPAQMHLLVVDDDAAVRGACAQIAAGMGFQTRVADSVPAARAALAHGAVDLMLLDLKLPGGGGMTLLNEVRSSYPRTGVIVMTAFATVPTALEAMRAGAYDYLTKPFALEELTSLLERSAQRRQIAGEARALLERSRTQKGFGPLLGLTPEMEKVYRILSKVTFTTHPVLILGESGTGKELVARAIHDGGTNATKPFVPVDCGSLVPTLIESELFGHVKGAFTGANRAKEGLLAAANGGTIFLDEIGELPLDLQAKLLRALQEKEVRPVGATHAVPISARVLAATNRDLAAMVEQGRFRKDLYFRLNVVNIRMPALRERAADIPLLAAHALERMRRDTGMTYTLADDALALLMAYDWPGNVRELEHTIERACALSSGPVLHANDFPTGLQDFRRHALQTEVLAATGAPATERAPVLSIAEMEKQAILNTIHQLNGDKLMAARLLGIGKTTLYRKLKEYGLDESAEQAGP